MAIPPPPLPFRQKVIIGLLLNFKNLIYILHVRSFCWEVKTFFFLGLNPPLTVHYNVNFIYILFFR